MSIYNIPNPAVAGFIHMISFNPHYIPLTELAAAPSCVITGVNPSLGTFGHLRTARGCARIHTAVLHCRTTGPPKLS